MEMLPNRLQVFYTQDIIVVNVSGAVEKKRTYNFTS